MKSFTRLFNLLEGELKIKPVVLSTVAYQHKQRGDSMFEAVGTMNPTPNLFIRRSLNCEGKTKQLASSGWGLGLDGTVNKCELLTIAVTVEEPKMLIGSTKKVSD
jgi:hypothetical protein